MRVAALYDVHGNLPALEAALCEIAERDVDTIVSGGDVAAGPMPSECIERLRVAGAVFVRGNADRNLSDWLAAELSEEQQALLTSLPTTTTLDIDALGEVLFCHSIPSSDEIYFLETTAESVAAELLGVVREHVVVCGHTHMQFDRRVGATRVVNAGSVGMPYEAEPGAYWALLGSDVELRRTEYDLERAAAAIRATNWPHANEFARENVLVVPPRAEALEVFEPGVGLPFPYGRGT